MKPSKLFYIGGATTLLVFLALNLIPYIATYHSYFTDGYEVIGFPLSFRRIGGYEGIYEFKITALLVDCVIALMTAFSIGLVILGRARNREKQLREKQP